MIKLTERELLSEIIEGISAKINRKALDEVLDSSFDLNEVLYNYYQRAHYLKPDPHYYYSFESVDLSDAQDSDYLKELGAKRYRKAYDYTRGNLEPIRQRNTGFGAEWSTGWVSGWRWLFDVYKYIEHNNIHVTTFEEVPS